eukprot:scaffold679773_cov59-Prasinocladus_malaysianus.AAC.1
MASRTIEQDDRSLGMTLPELCHRVDSDFISVNIFNAVFGSDNRHSYCISDDAFHVESMIASLGLSLSA